MMIPSNILDRIYQTFYEISPDLIYTLDEKGVILDVNKRMLEHTGYSKAEIIGKSCFDFIVDEYKKTALDGFSEMIEKGIGQQIEIALIKKNNESFFCLCRGASIPQQDTNTNAYLVTLQDITIMRQAFERAQVAEDESEKRYNGLKKAHEKLAVLEKKYRNLYEHSPDLLRTINLEGIIVDCNESYARNLGYSKDEIIGSSITEHTAEKSYNSLAEGIEEWKKTGTISNLEVWLKRKDDSIFPTLLSGTNLYDEEGNVIGRTVSLRDITDMYNARILVEKDQEKIRVQYDELKKINALLKETEQKFRNLYDTSPDMLRTINSDGMITDCNLAYASGLGYTKDEIIGSSIFDHVASNDIDKIRETFDAWKSGKTITNSEIRMKRKDGTVFPCLLSATTFYQDNKMMGSNTVIKDITELHKARERIEENEIHIRQQYEQMRRAEKLKEEFIAMITHELKTPLVPILGYADVLLTEVFGSLVDEQKKRLDMIRSNAKYMIDLISDLLDVQKIDLRQLNLHMEYNNISEIIQQAVDNMKPQVEKHSIIISTQIQPNIFSTCDKLRIIQIISNLIRNAIDFCPKQNGKIFVSCNSDGNSYKVIIKDNGIGISKNNLEKVFVKFYQVDTSVTREHGGSGLGLAVCKGIVENHGGKIWAESNGEGSGTEIHILLPIK